MTLPLALVESAQTSPAPFSIQWDTNQSTVRVVGRIDSKWQKLSAHELQQIFPVTVEQATVLHSIGVPPMVGNYKATEGWIEFRPQYSFEPGISYRATFAPAKVTAVLKIPRRTPTRSTVVSQIFPSADALPQNLLKFYIHFSGPMSGGQIYEHIHLAEEDGTAVELPFLEINEELWNPEMTRLTLFLDPGRIKREVKPLEEVGPALVPGKKYILTVDEMWLDAQGAPLKQSHKKRFAVDPPDRESPEPSQWRIRSPKSNTADPLEVSFDDPLDQALALRMIALKGVAGKKTLGTNERSWRFEPDDPWKSGRYELLVQSTIEDLAGNNIGKLFEVDLQDGSAPREPAKTVRLFFQVD
jgi:hypothetical protein